jgi:YrbI family 3-deoxy-D-manno-octulosonate 8-phosphate phosphatase
MENNPEYILKAAENFSVEIDVWYVDGKYFLGHDKPQHEIEKYFLFNEKFLIHAKTMLTFFELSKYGTVEVFFQADDDLAFTTKKRIVIHGRHNVVEGDEFGSIWIDLEGRQDAIDFGIKNAVLTDFPQKYSTLELRSTLIFDLLILDIDGVLTNGRKSYKNDGAILAKEFNDKDFTAIKRFLAQGVKVIFLSGDKNVNEAMSEIRGIDFYYAKNQFGNIDKGEMLSALKEKYEANLTAYVGDDYYDLSIIERVDFSFCPNDATQDVKQAVDKVLKSNGGEGVIAELFDYTMRFEPKIYAHDYINGK